MAPNDQSGSLSVRRKRSSFWIKLIFLALLLLFCSSLFSVFWIGARQPLEHRVSLQTELPLDADSLWNVLADLRGHPAWRPEITVVQVMSEDSSGLVYREFLDDREGMRFRVEERVPGKRWVVRNISADYPVDQLWSWKLEEIPGGCRVTLTEEGRIRSTTLRYYFSRVAGYDSQIRLRLQQLMQGLGLEAEIREVAL